MAYKPLTPKQKSFIHYYLNGSTMFNARGAAIKAGYSKRSASVIGYENLNKPYIKEEIEKRIEEKGMGKDEVLVRLAEQARGDYNKYLQSDGTVDLESLIAEDKGHLIKSLTPNKYGTKVEFYDGQSALSLLGKYHSLFTDKLEVGIQHELESILDRLEAALDPDTYNKILNVLSADS